MIDVRLGANDSNFTLQSGSITTHTSGSDITLTADDFDFFPAPSYRDSGRLIGGLEGEGELVLKTISAKDFLLGTAAENSSGFDLDKKGLPQGIGEMAQLG